MPLDASAEILAKKLFYRAASAKVRDLFDLGVVLAHEPQVEPLLRSVLVSRAAQLRRRAEALQPALAARVQAEISVLPAGASQTPAALEGALAFLLGLA